MINRSHAGPHPGWGHPRGPRLGPGTPGWVPHPWALPKSPGRLGVWDHWARLLGTGGGGDMCVSLSLSISLSLSLDRFPNRTPRKYLGDTYSDIPSFSCLLVGLADQNTVNMTFLYKAVPTLANLSQL